jgi:hypothetical protein
MSFNVRSKRNWTLSVIVYTCELHTLVNMTVGHTVGYVRKLSLYRFFCAQHEEAARFQLKNLAVSICDLDWGNQVKKGYEWSMFIDL